MNPGFQFGLLGGLINFVIRFLFQAIIQARTSGAVLSWLIGLMIYYSFAHLAAKKQLEMSYRDEADPKSITGAGVGAALIASIVTWTLMLIWTIIQNEHGQRVPFEPVILCGTLFLDLGLAIGLGQAAAKQLIKQQNILEDF